ncbi:putative reverse transcriptase domain-containing protein, partial [Tanacetum coccineum]
MPPRRTSANARSAARPARATDLTNGHASGSHNSDTGIRGTFEKNETVFHISNCGCREPSDKFATSAPSYGNSPNMVELPHDRLFNKMFAYAMDWKALKKMMTVKIQPKGVKSRKLALMCGRMFHEESEEVEKYDGGLPDMIRGNVMSYQPKMMEKAIEFTNDQMDQKVLTITERQAECNKCKKISHLARDCMSSGPNGNNNNRGNFGTTQNVVTCYECGGQGHFKKDFPKLKNRNGHTPPRQKREALTRMDIITTH